MTERCRRLRLALGLHLGLLGTHPPRPIRSTVRSPSPSGTSGNASLPTFTIVTPVRNQEATIGQTIESVLAASQGLSVDYVVQDGDSTDGTPRVIGKRHRQNPAAFRWRSERDQGQADAINRGFAGSRGEIMGFLNGDDLLLPGALQAIAETFSRHPEVDVIYGDRVLINQDGDEIGVWRLPKHDPEIIRWIDFIPQETMYWRREAWERAGGAMDASLHFALDWDLIIRFQQTDARWLHIPELLAAFRVHDQQKTRQELGSVGLEEMNRLRRRALGRVPGRLEIILRAIPYLCRHAALTWKHRLHGQ